MWGTMGELNRVAANRLHAGSPGNARPLVCRFKKRTALHKQRQCFCYENAKRL